MDYLAYVFISLLSAAIAAFFTLRLLRRQAAPQAQPAQFRQERGGASLIFDFSAAEARTLAGLLKNESPDDIALVLWGMERPSAQALLAELPAGRRAAALAALAVPREADLSEMRAMRDELVRRMYGKAGGPALAASFLRALPYQERKGLYEDISALDQSAADGMREHFVMEEDLLYMPDDAMRAFCSAASPAELGRLLPSLPEKLSIRIREQFTENAALAAHKAASGAPALPQETAVSALVGIMEGLVARGLVKKPPVRIKTP